jgi:hypothetical protein
MKNEKEYSLDEAIKNFYKSEPLKIDLANTVANKAFIKRNEVSVVWDKWLYVFAAAIILGALIYSFNFLKDFSLSLLLLIVIPMVSYFGLSAKEFLLMSKKLPSFE